MLKKVKLRKKSVLHTYLCTQILYPHFVMKDLNYFLQFTTERHELFIKNLERAVFVNSSPIMPMYPKEKKEEVNESDKPKTLIQPVERPELFKDFIDYITSLDLGIECILLQAGVSFKYRKNKTERNLFSFRSVRLKDNEVYLCLSLNSVTSQEDLESLNLGLEFDSIDNYFKSKSISLSEAKESLSMDVLKRLILYVKRIDSMFKSRKNVS